jgi:signal transduction histidine kinase
MVASGHGRWARASIRVRTTIVSAGVVALALIVGALTLSWLMAESLTDGLETTAEQQILALEQQWPVGSGPAQVEDADEVDEMLWQILDANGQVVASSADVPVTLPAEETDRIQIPGEEHPRLLATEDVSRDGNQYVIAVAVSREPISEALHALVAPLLIGIPLLLLVVAGTTWLVATRALAPVEQIRREVAQISDEQLDRRVPQPPSQDEISRLASTMNQMLERLEQSRQRQQQFVADASHELRSPLASIRQYAEVARAHPDAVPREELVEAVFEESTRMQELIRQLLFLARLDEPASGMRSVEVDLDDLVLEAANRARTGGASLDTSSVGPARIEGDPVAMRQVVDNLIENACRFANEQVILHLQEKDGLVTLMIDDDGPGVPTEDRSRVFERFVRLDGSRSRSSGGTGLGLAITQEIVTLHQGRVEVADSPLGGARFVVSLRTS